MTRYNFKKYFSLKIIFVSADGADPDEMPHYAAFHLGSLFAKVPIMGVLVFNGLK